MKRIVTALALVAVLFSASVSKAADIIDTAKAAGVFNTLLAAATAAGLVPTLEKARNVTVFAPTDAAFAKLPEGTVAALLQPKNKAKLAAIIAYHVVPARVLSNQVPRQPTFVPTLNASKAQLLVVRNKGVVRVNGYRVIQPDIRADGGNVIHVVNTVLWPGEIRPH